MPNGRVHNSVTILTAAWIALLAPVYLPHTGPDALFMLPGCATALLINPDLDVDGGNQGYGIIRRNLGRPAEFIWGAIWFPYSRVIPHRHWISHVPFISTAVRILYICILTIGFFGQVVWLVQTPGFWWFCVGLAACDMHHWFMDTFTKGGWQ